MNEDRTVPIRFDYWQSHGGRMMKWAKENIGEGSYKLKFDGHDAPVLFVFNDNTQAFTFKMCIALGGPEILGERTTYP